MVGLFELVDEIDDFLRVAADLVEIGLFIDEVQELELSAWFALLGISWGFLVGDELVRIPKDLKT